MIPKLIIQTGPLKLSSVMSFCTARKYARGIADVDEIHRLAAVTEN
jgi:hypothetical protein